MGQKVTLWKHTLDADEALSRLAAYATSQPGRSAALARRVLRGNLSPQDRIDVADRLLPEGKPDDG